MKTKYILTIEVEDDLVVNMLITKKQYEDTYYKALNLQVQHGKLDEGFDIKESDEETEQYYRHTVVITNACTHTILESYTVKDGYEFKKGE